MAYVCVCMCGVQEILNELGHRLNLKHKQYVKNTTRKHKQYCTQISMFDISGAIPGPSVFYVFIYVCLG